MRSIIYLTRRFEAMPIYMKAICFIIYVFVLSLGGLFVTGFLNSPAGIYFFTFLWTAGTYTSGLFIFLPKR